MTFEKVPPPKKKNPRRGGVRPVLDGTRIRAEFSYEVLPKQKFIYKKKATQESIYAYAYAYMHICKPNLNHLTNVK